MLLTKLQVTQLRNLKKIECEPVAGFNLIVGDNGSGKSSLLEAIHLLGAGRSFRHANSKTTSLSNLIQHGAEQSLCVGRFVPGQHDSEMMGAQDFSIGIALHRRDGITAKIAGEKISAASRLAQILPLMVVNSLSFQLVDGPSQMRRQYLDWGLFHVKQDYLLVLQDWRRCLRQRNQLLRSQHGKIATELTLWSKELARYGEVVDIARRDYSNALAPIMVDLADRLGAVGELELSYYSGWDSSIPFSEQLDRDLDRDRVHGFTSHGPHRADLRLKWKGGAAAERLSRGQIKVLVLALKLAQDRMVRKNGIKKPIFLIDDLAAELDGRHRQLFCELLSEERAQVFMTAVERQQIDIDWFGQIEHRVFHVKQGQIF